MQSPVSEFRGPLLALPEQTLVRGSTLSWAISFAAALQLSLLLLLQSPQKDRPVAHAPSPEIDLNFVVLPPKQVPKPKPKPKTPAPQPETEAKVEPPIRVVERVTAPVAVTETQEGPADILSSPVSEPEIIRIESPVQLDNISFDPIFVKKPKYPRVALEEGIEGWVDADLVVDETGHVEQFTIVDVSGHSAFARETGKVLGNWRFPPPRINGKKMKVKYFYRVNFQLNG